ncbi:roadblock/LC7 domain-containing protein [Hamadaea sp. NPDC050747]|uniref:roadblock/LC7 domain-containing protein n=1 Tax=Hamadaea sp. NPDC050747 TaxID=3155789 RepID=UPI0033CB57D6
MSPLDPGRQAMFSDILTQLASQVPTISHAVAMSADGLLLASTPRLSRDQAEKLCASVAGEVALARSTADFLQAGDHQYSMVVMRDGVLVVQPTPDGSTLAALAPQAADAGQLAFHLADLAQRIGQQLSPGLRTAIR